MISASLSPVPMITGEREWGGGEVGLWEVPGPRRVLICVDTDMTNQSS